MPRICRINFRSLVLGCSLALLAWTVAAAADQNHKQVFVLCISKTGLKQYVQPREAMLVYEALVAEYMIPQLKFPIRFVFFENDAEMYRAFRRGEADIGCGNLDEFLNEYEHRLVTPMVWFEQKKADAEYCGDHYVLIVKKKSGIRSLAQLRHKILAITHPHDRKKIRYVFFPDQPGFRENEYFKKVTLYESSRDAVYSLFFNATDVVFETEYFLNSFRRLRPELSDSLTTLDIPTETLAALPIFYRSSLDQEKMAEMEKIKGFFLKMNEDEGLHQMLIFMGCDRVQPVTAWEEEAYRLWVKKYRKMGLYH